MPRFFSSSLKALLRGWAICLPVLPIDLGAFGGRLIELQPHVFLRFRPGTQREAPGLEPFGPAGSVAYRSRVNSGNMPSEMSPSGFAARGLFVVLQGSPRESVCTFARRKTFSGLNIHSLAFTRLSYLFSQKGPLFMTSNPRCHSPRFTCMLYHGSEKG